MEDAKLIFRMILRTLGYIATNGVVIYVMSHGFLITAMAAFLDGRYFWGSVNGLFFAHSIFAFAYREEIRRNFLCRFQEH